MAEPYLQQAPPPVRDKVIGADGLLTPAWRNWFERLPATLDAAPLRISAVSLTTQAASLAATNFAGATLLAGLYRATYYARITQAATTSSSLTVSLRWTEGSVVQTATGSAIVGNTTATGQSDSILINIDAGSQVQYLTTYASVGATAMQYAINFSLEKVRT